MKDSELKQYQKHLFGFGLTLCSDPLYFGTHTFFD